MIPDNLRFRFRKNHLLLWLPPLLFFLLISFFSSLSHPPKVLPDFFMLDKIEHFSIYFVFGALLARSGLWELTWHPVWSYRLKIILLILIFSAGAIDEWHQSFVPNRDVDFFDWVADTFGALCGFALCRVIYKKHVQKIIKGAVL